MATLMITGYPSVEGAVQAVKVGAEDFLPKPFTDQELTSAVETAIDKLKARRAIHGDGSGSRTTAGLVCACEPMRRVVRAIERVAVSQAPVLILGESGSGREAVARAIRSRSDRAEKPFISARLLVIPATQAETEVFGRAVRSCESSAGLFGAAQGGVLYVEAIDRASVELQTRLVERLANPTEKAPRLIAASSRELGPLVKQCGFLEDLCARLSATTIEIPPLRDRGDDVLLLVNHFAGEIARQTGQLPAHFSDQAIWALRTYSWPGNVRELRSVVERLLAVAGPEGVDVTDLPELLRFAALRQSARRTLAEVETEHILAVLSATEGKRSLAAQILGIDRKTLREKLKRAGLGDGSADTE
jgi:DNA-binding NtrC family response regulator